MHLFAEKLLSPYAVHFTKEPEWTGFVNGYDLETALGMIQAAPGVHGYDITLLAPFPPIEVARRKSLDGDGEAWFALEASNRRLYCLQRAALLQWPKHVAVFVEVLPKAVDVGPLCPPAASSAWDWRAHARQRDTTGLARRALTMVQEDEQSDSTSLHDVPGSLPMHEQEAEFGVSNQSELVTPRKRSASPMQAAEADLQTKNEHCGMSERAPGPSLEEAFSRVSLPSPMMLALPGPPRGLRMPSAASPMNITLATSGGSPCASPTARRRTTSFSSDDEGLQLEERWPCVPQSDALRGRSRLESQVATESQERPRRLPDEQSLGTRQQGQVDRSGSWKAGGLFSETRPKAWNAAPFDTQQDAQFLRDTKGQVKANVPSRGSGHAMLDTVNVNLSGIWSSDGKTYRCCRHDLTTWSCMREDICGFSKHLIEVDEVTQRLYWNTSPAYYAELYEVLSGAGEIHWKPTQSAQMMGLTWVRRTQVDSARRRDVGRGGKGGKRGGPFLAARAK